MSAVNPEQLAEQFATGLVGNNDPAIAERWMLVQTIANAVKEALHERRAEPAPAFKVESLNRDARYLTAAANLLSEAAHLREISYAEHPSIKEKIAEARRILEMLSSEDADQ